MKAIRIPHHPMRHGFTLTELAIVLLVVGVIVGSIWIAAEHAWDNYRVYRTNQQMVKLVQNIREYYMNAQNLPAGNITATLDGLPPPNGSLFPIEMRRNPGAAGGPIDHPFNANWLGGSLQVQGIACPLVATTRACFRIQILGLTQAPCIKLLTFIPVDDAELGIAQVGAQAGVAQPMPAATSTTSLATPVIPSKAEAWCNVAGDANEVDWDFKLRN